MRDLPLGWIPLFYNRPNVLLYISSTLYRSILGLLVIESGTSNEISLWSSNNSNKTHIRPIKSAFALEPVWNPKR
jgi:hypothetical protein